MTKLRLKISKARKYYNIFDYINNQDKLAANIYGYFNF